MAESTPKRVVNPEHTKFAGCPIFSDVRSELFSVVRFPSVGQRELRI